MDDYSEIFNLMDVTPPAELYLTANGEHFLNDAAFVSQWIASTQAITAIIRQLANGCGKGEQEMAIIVIQELVDSYVNYGK